MSDTEPRNNLSWRVSVLEAEVKSLKDGKPDVVAERVTRLSGDVEILRRQMHEELRELRDDDIKGLRDELAAQRKILIAAFSSIAFGLILAYVVGGGGAVGG